MRIPTCKQTYKNVGFCLLNIWRNHAPINSGLWTPPFAYSRRFVSEKPCRKEDTSMTLFLLQLVEEGAGENLMSSC